jgi:hypothetical protein
MGALESVIANKFIKTLSVAEGPSRGSVPATSQVTTSGTPPNGIFKTGTELMYRGQGKVMSTTNLTIVTDTQNEMVDVMDISMRETETGGGLAPPWLSDTNEEATGDDRKKLRLQNKRRRQHLKDTQQPQSLWTNHTGTVPYESRIAGHIGIRCVRQGGHFVTPQPTRCASGPRLAARHA